MQLPLSAPSARAHLRRTRLLPFIAVVLLLAGYTSYGVAEAYVPAIVAEEITLLAPLRELLGAGGPVVALEGAAGTTPGAAASATSSSVARRRPAEDSVSVRLRAQNGRELSPRFHFTNDTARLVLDDRHFRPGFYRMSVTTTDAETGVITTAEQDLAWGVLAMNADRDRYRQGEVAQLAMGVLDEYGEIVCDAELRLRIRHPDGTLTGLSTDDGGIAITGTCGRKEAGLIAPDYATSLSLPQSGTYELELTAVRPSLRRSTSTVTGTLRVDAAAPFDVQRVAATRLWPFAPSTMEVEVRFARDFAGRVTDVVPQGFTVLDTWPPATVDLHSGSNDIAVMWEGAWSAGDTARFSYTYDAPDISPEFYLIGPLQLLATDGWQGEEARAWQIANDAASRSATYDIVSDVMGAGGGEQAVSTNYRLSDTIGEGLIGYGASDNYVLNSGYRQTGNDYVGIACAGPTTLGTITLNGRATGSGTCTITTTNPSGYSLAWAVLTGSGGYSTGSLISQYEKGIRPFNLSGGMLGHWRLDETTGGVTVVDSSGFGRNGTPAGTGGGNNLPQPSTDLPSSTNFRDLRSLDFDGTDDRVSMGDVLAFERTDAFSVAFWMKASSLGETNIVSKQEDSGSYRGWGVYTSTARGKLGFFLYSGAQSIVVDFPSNYADGTWHHVVVSYNGNSDASGLTFYVDGASVSKTTVSNNLTSASIVSTAALQLSGRGGASNPYPGLLNDVRIYNRTLSAAEAAVLYGTPQTWSVASVDAYWGARLSTASDDDDAKWGTDGVSEKWLPIGDGSYPVVTRATPTDLDGSLQIIDYTVEIGAERVVTPGTYAATVTYTASAL